MQGDGGAGAHNAQVGDLCKADGHPMHAAAYQAMTSPDEGMLSERAAT